VRSLFRFSHLARSFGFADPNHRLVVGVATLIGLFAYLRSGIVGGLEAAVTASLAWALARELDPDQPGAAPWVAAAATLPTLFVGSPSLAALALLMLAARVVARTTGLPPAPADMVGLLALAGLAAVRTPGWIAGMALAVAVAVDVSLPRPAPRRQLAWAAAMGLVVSAVAGLAGSPDPWIPPTTVHWLAVGVGLAGAVVLAVLHPVGSVADRTAEPLDVSRVRLARLLVLTAAAVTALVGGADGMGALLPVWLVLAGLGAARLGRSETPS
jgi:hypothetical protein